MLMGECKLDSSERSKLALALLEKAEYDKDVPLNYCVEAAKDYNDLDKAVNFLIKECPLCFETTSVHEVRILLFLEWVRSEVGGYAGMSPPVALSVQSVIPSQSASQEEQNGTNFSFVTHSSEEL